MLPNDIKNLLKDFSTIYKENDKNIIIRCPYCGDSKNPRHAHLYISKTDPPYPFHCFRAECEAKGTLIKFLSDFDLLDKVEKTTLLALSKNDHSLQKYRFNHSILDSKIKTITDDFNENLSFKLDYVKQRLQTDTIPDWFLKHIVIDFKPIIKSDISMNSMVRNNLQNKYIGFLTYHKKKIICRRITNDGWLPRYYVINLEDDLDHFILFPNPNTKLLSDDGIIVIGEGVFDIVNGYLKLKDEYLTNPNIMLSANAGSGYYATYKTIVKKFGLVDWKVYIFADNDVSDSTIYKLFKYEPVQIYIVRNELDKDMGAKFVNPVMTKLK